MDSKNKKTSKFESNFQKYLIICTGAKLLQPKFCKKKKTKLNRKVCQKYKKRIEKKGKKGKKRESVLE